MSGLSTSATLCGPINMYCTCARHRTISVAASYFGSQETATTRTLTTVRQFKKAYVRRIDLTTRSAKRGHLHWGFLLQTTHHSLPGTRTRAAAEATLGQVKKVCLLAGIATHRHFSCIVSTDISCRFELQRFEFQEQDSILVCGVSNFLK